VKVIQGPQEGQEGKVTAILRKENRVIVEDVNMVLLFVSPLPQQTSHENEFLEKKNCQERSTDPWENCIETL
jgi:ribosomal protein L24